MALAYSVKPQSLVHTYLLAGGNVDDKSGILAQVAAKVIIIVYLAKETDTL